MTSTDRDDPATVDWPRVVELVERMLSLAESALYVAPELASQHVHLVRRLAEAANAAATGLGAVLREDGDYSEPADPAAASAFRQVVAVAEALRMTAASRTAVVRSGTDLDWDQARSLLGALAADARAAVDRAGGAGTGDA